MEGTYKGHQIPLFPPCCQVNDQHPSTSSTFFFFFLNQKETQNQAKSLARTQRSGLGNAPAVPPGIGSWLFAHPCPPSSTPPHPSPGHVWSLRVAMGKARPGSHRAPGEGTR